MVDDSSFDWSSVDWLELVKRYTLAFAILFAANGLVVFGFCYLFSHVLV